MEKIKREIIKENKEYLEDLLKKIENKHLIYRIQMLIFLKTIPEITLKEVNKLLPVSYPTIARWWGDYKKGGLGKLLEWNVKGYQGKLTKQQEEEFLNEVKKGRFKTQKEMIKWIKEEYDVEYSQQGMSDLLKRLGVKKKVGRPVHPKKDKKQEEKFKENFKKIVNKNKDIFF